MKSTDEKTVRSRSGKLAHRRRRVDHAATMGYWEPDYQVKDTDILDTDILAMFRVTPQPGVDVRNDAGLVAPFGVSDFAES